MDEHLQALLKICDSEGQYDIASQALVLFMQEILKPAGEIPPEVVQDHPAGAAAYKKACAGNVLTLPELKALAHLEHYLETGPKVDPLVLSEQALLDALMPRRASLAPGVGSATLARGGVSSWGDYAGSPSWQRDAPISFANLYISITVCFAIVLFGACAVPFTLIASGSWPLPVIAFGCAVFLAWFTWRYG